MVTCIGCCKCELEDGDDNVCHSVSNAGNKQAVKNFSSQIKDMVLKLSGLQSKEGISSRYHGSSSYLDDTYFTTINNRRRRRWIPFPGEDLVIEDDSEPKEWMAQVEPGVHITFISLPAGSGNHLKRIRFSRDMFNKWQAQRWWGENYERIMELYNVQKFNRHALPTPTRSEEDERESYYSRVGSTRESPVVPHKNKERLLRNTNRPPHHNTTDLTAKVAYVPPVRDPSRHIFPHYMHSATSSTAAVVAPNLRETSSFDASRTTTSSRDEASVSVSNASDLEITEWIEQDEPGVSITIRELADGTRELRRIRFSRERFREENAKLWWENNRERIQAHYL